MVIVQADIFYAPPPHHSQDTEPLPTPTSHTSSISLAKSSSTIPRTSINELTSLGSSTTDSQSSTTRSSTTRSSTTQSSTTQSSTSTQLITITHFFIDSQSSTDTITITQFSIDSQSSTDTSISATSSSTGPRLSPADTQSSIKSSISSIGAHMSTSANFSSVGLPSSISSQFFGASSISSLNSISSTSAISSSTGSSHPTQSLVTAGKSLGPIIGGIIGGITFVALSTLTIVMIINRCRRRRHQKQDASLPTANPLLVNPHITKLAAQRDFLEKGPRSLFNLQNPSANGSLDLILSQSHNQNPSTLRRSNQGPVLSLSPSDFESIMQRQMEIISTISQRMMVLEAHQLGHQATATEPPDYEGHTPT